MGGAKIEQRGQPVRFQGAAFEFGVAHFQPVELGAHGVVFFLRAAQADVSAPAVLGAVDRPGADALQRRNQFHRPHADQPHLPLALDLHGQQQHLRDDDGRQQRQ